MSKTVEERCPEQLERWRISKQDGNLKKESNRHCKWKILSLKLKTHQINLTARWGAAEDRMSRLQDPNSERKKRLERTDIWIQVKWTNALIFGVPEGEGREGAEVLFEKVMAEIFQNWDQTLIHWFKKLSEGPFTLWEDSRCSRAGWCAGINGLSCTLAGMETSSKQVLPDGPPVSTPFCLLSPP